MPLPTIRLLLLDDHSMVATALARSLSLSPGITVGSVLGSLSELTTETHSDSACPDVAIVDYYLSEGTGIDAAELLAERCPRCRVVVMSARSSPEQLREALGAGCVGYIDKTSSLDDLIRVVHAADRGEASFDADALRAALRQPEGVIESTSGNISLSAREGQILTMLAAGLSTEVMSTELYLSAHTVRNHVRNLTAKLGAHSRLEAVALAARAGLVTMLQAPR